MNISALCEVREPTQDYLVCIGLPLQFARRIVFPIARPSGNEKPPPAKRISALMLRQLYYDADCVGTDREAADGKKQ
jgi:hypothetical protein